MSKKIYLIDWNSFIYRMFFGLPEFATKEWKVVNAIFGMAKFFVDSLVKQNPDYLIFLKDAKWKNFRHDLYEDYKATRDRMPDNLRTQMGDIEKMMRSMGGMGGRGGKGKLDMNAMQQHFDRQTKISGMKDRADKRADERREKIRKDEEHRIWAETQPNTIHPSLLKELGLDENDFIYTNGEKPERTPRPNAGDGNSKKSKSAGGKKKKKKGKK